MCGSGATNHRLVSGINPPEKCRLPDSITNPKAACTAQHGGIGYAMLPCFIKKAKSSLHLGFPKCRLLFCRVAAIQIGAQSKKCRLLDKYLPKQPARFILPNLQYLVFYFPRPSPISLPDTGLGNFLAVCFVPPLCAHCESACAGCPHPHGDIAPQTP